MLSKLANEVKKFQTILRQFPTVRYAGDPILRQPTQAVSVTEGARLGHKLGDVLQRYRQITGYGRGLAAPQIGASKAVFVTFVDDQIQIFLNPKIIRRSKRTNFYRELCLSSGIMSADVERSEWIIMAWTDEQGQKQQQRFDGFLARLYQHEEAHLRGQLNIDEAVAGGIEFALFDPLQEKLRDRN